MEKQGCTIITKGDHPSIIKMTDVRASFKDVFLNFCTDVVPQSDARTHSLLWP